MLRNKVAGFRELLGNAPFIRLFAGRVITDAGDSLYSIGSMWLVWEITGSSFYTGLAGALVQMPSALRFLVGPLVDRWRLRRILLGTQVVNGVGVLVVPVAAAMGWLSVWVVLVLMPVLAFVNNFVYPAQNAALPRLVEDEQLTRANSLFSTSIQTVDMIANAIGGALIAVIGGAVALFVVDSVTFAIAALLFVGVTVPATTRDDASGAVDVASGDADDTDETEADDAEGGYLAELRDGFGYVRGSALLPLFPGVMVANSTLMAATAVLPAFADSIGGPAAYGLLMAALGAGSFLGTAGSFLVEDHSISRIAIFGFPLAGLSWLLAIAVPGVWPTAGLLLVAGVPIGAFNVLFSSLLQSAVADGYLGRVSSLATSLAMLMGPIGALLGGAIGGVVGSRVVMYAAGGAIATLGSYFLVHPSLRSLPVTAEADEAALGLRTTIGTATENVETSSGYSSE